MAVPPPLPSMSLCTAPAAVPPPLLPRARPWLAPHPLERQKNEGFPDGSHSWEHGPGVAPENSTGNQRQLDPLGTSFSGAPCVVINTGTPHALVIAPLSHSVRPLSVNVRP